MKRTVGLIALIFFDKKEKNSSTQNNLFRLNAFCRRRRRDDNEREEKLREEEQQTKTCDQHSLSLSFRSFFSSLLRFVFFVFFSLSLLFSRFCVHCGSRIECGANFINCVLDVFFSHHSFTPLSPSKYTKKQTRNVRNKKCTRCARR